MSLIRKLTAGILALIIAGVSVVSLGCPPKLPAIPSGTVTGPLGTTTSPAGSTPSTSTTSTPPVSVPPGNANLNLSNTDPFTLDPAAASEATSAGYVMQIFSGLIQLDDSLNPAPDLASGWKTDSTGKVFTFTLRQGAKFQDGRAVTAEDVKYSWERACNPKTQSQTAGTYLIDIVGAADMLSGKATSLSGVTVIDQSTLQVTIDAPKPYFLYKLGYPTSFVVDKNNVAKGANWWRTPNGTGPFKLKSWTQTQELVLQRNDNYYGQMAVLATVTYKLSSAGVPQRMYETGDIDAVGVGQGYIDLASDPAGPYLSQLSVYPELSFSYIGFNCAQAPFDDPNIRKAFSMAVDKKKLASLMFKDMVAPAKGILPPGMPGYNTQLQGLNFDVAAAKDLIAKSKYGDVSKLPPITITTSGYAPDAGTLTGIIYDWKQNLGVDVKVRVLEPERFFYALKTEKDQMFDIGWIADYPHPQDFLDVLFRSGGDNNWGEYSNTQVDTQLAQAGVNPDNQKALAQYQQIEQLIVNDAACLPLWTAKEYLLVKPYVLNYKPTPLGFVKLNRVIVNR